MAELQYEAGMYQSLYENAKLQLEARSSAEVQDALERRTAPPQTLAVSPAIVQDLDNEVGELRQTVTRLETALVGIADSDSSYSAADLRRRAKAALAITRPERKGE